MKRPVHRPVAAGMSVNPAAAAVALPAVQLPSGKSPASRLVVILVERRSEETEGALDLSGDNLPVHRPLSAGVNRHARGRAVANGTVGVPACQTPVGRHAVVLVCD